MNAPARPIVVAIDGPAASGKSSTAGAVARELGYRHLDSGAFYRALTYAALRHRIPPDHWHTLHGPVLDSFQVGARPTPTGFIATVDGHDVEDELRSPEVNAHVSTIAAVPAVRSWLLRILRSTRTGGGLVADGRDIGTVVFPDAQLKIFLVADPEVRARRRLAQQGLRDPDLDQVQAESLRLVERDRRDQARSVAPLLRAPDAVALDTTSLSFDAQVRAIARLARSRAAG